MSALKEELRGIVAAASSGAGEPPVSAVTEGAEDRALDDAQGFDGGDEDGLLADGGGGAAALRGGGRLHSVAERAVRQEMREVRG